MKSKNTFDIIVIGAGAGGLNIASFMNSAGFSVLLIDKSDSHIGGDCLNFGCVPSKALIHAARTVQSGKKAQEFGLGRVGELDWSKVRDYIKSKQDIIRKHENADWFRSKGMTVLLGHASFVGRNSVSVDGMEYSAKRIVLATGSRPRQLQTLGIEKVARVLNNENIFTMDSLPERVLFVGAGPIGMELAQALNILGSLVTVVDPGAQILGKEDAVVAKLLQDKMTSEGVIFKIGAKLKEFTGTNTVEIILANGKTEEIKFDAVFVGIGRVLNVEGLDLAKADIKQEENGRIVVDEYLRTTNKNVFLCGDIAGNYQFTHAAELHAGLIIRNFFSPIKRELNLDHMSYTTYTTPEIATYGLSENEIIKRGIKYRVLESDFSHDDRAITDEYQNSLAKMFVDQKGKILGGTIVAPNAGELVSELVLAMSASLSIKHIFNKTYAYPTAARINKSLVAGYFREKLNAFSKLLLRLLY